MAWKQHLMQIDFVVLPSEFLSFLVTDSLFWFHLTVSVMELSVLSWDETSEMESWMSKQTKSDSA